jgi:hypothetical protein
MYNNQMMICEVTNKNTGVVEVEVQPSFYAAKRAMIRKYAYQQKLGGYLNFVRTRDDVVMAENEKYQIAIIA